MPGTGCNCLFIGLALAVWLMAGAAIAGDAPTFRADAQFISVDVQVVSNDRTVVKLKQKDFLVWDNGHPEVITNFGPDDQVIDLILLIDVSGSTMPIAAKIRSTAAEAMSTLYFRDRVGLVIFDSMPYLVAAPSWDWFAVDTKLRQMRWLAGGTELNDSILATARYLMQHARPEARRAIIILTDNKGGRAVPDNAVREELWDGNVVLNALIFAPTPGDFGSADVRKFTRATGGELLRFNKEHIPFAEMFRRLRERYVLMYRAPNAKAGSIRHIRVDLTSEARSGLKGVHIRSRTGYRAGPPPSANQVTAN